MGSIYASLASVQNTFGWPEPAVNYKLQKTDSWEALELEVGAALSNRPKQISHLRRRGHRVGIFLTSIGAVLFLFGAASESYSTNADDITRVVGGSVALFGYGVARLWYWTRAA